MPDSLSDATATTTAELPYDPLLGLRGRHRADMSRPRYNQDGGGDVDDDDDDDENILPGQGREEEDNGDIGNDNENEDGDGDVPFNNADADGDVRPLEESSNPANTFNNINNNINNNNRNRNTTIMTPPPLSSLSPFSGSIGIGVFRISRLYCLMSVISAILAIVVAPISTSQIEYHDWTTIMYRVAEGIVGLGIIQLYQLWVIAIAIANTI